MIVDPIYKFLNILSSKQISSSPSAIIIVDPATPFPYITFFGTITGSSLSLNVGQVLAAPDSQVPQGPDLQKNRRSKSLLKVLAKRGGFDYYL